MNLWNDASVFMQSKTPEQTIQEDIFTLDTPQKREKVISFLRHEYENATYTEIDRAIDWTMGQLEKPYSKELFLKKIRPKLED